MWQTDVGLEKNQSWKQYAVIYKNSLIGLLHLLLKELRVLLPRPWSRFNAITLKEWKLYFVDQTIDKTIGSKSQDMNQVCGHKICHINVSEIQNTLPIRLTYSWNKYNYTSHNERSKYKPVAFNFVPLLFTLNKINCSGIQLRCFILRPRCLSFSL